MEEWVTAVSQGEAFYAQGRAGVIWTFKGRFWGKGQGGEEVRALGKIELAVDLGNREATSWDNPLAVPF